MQSSNSELCRIRSKSCYSNSTHRPRTCHSSQGTFRCDIRSSDSCSRLGSIGDHTIEIHQENVVNIDLPPLMWFGYNKIPKILSATNTGRTILVNGQWACGRPYITGGPLNGSYIFSQIHFHSPSEHKIDGRRYPLEMHVVHYKNSYLTQERAMKEQDGTIVLVYLFQLIEHGTTIVSQISKFASCLERKNARREISKIPLDQFATPFNSNYYTYRSSVPTDKNFYLLQWIISCTNLYVTRQEVEELLFVMNSSESVGHVTPMQPENDVVFRVGEEDYCDWLISSQTTENPCCQQKKVKSMKSVCEKPSKKCVCEKPSKKCVCEKPSKKCVCERPSKKLICKKASKKSVCEKPSKKSVCEKPSKKCVKKKSSKKSVCEKPSKTSVCKKSSKKSGKKSSKTSINKKSSNTSVCEKNSNTFVCKESSTTSIVESSSGTSCTLVKEMKVKKGKNCKSAKVDSGTNTTPSCSKSDIKEKKKKEKKSKDVCVTKKQSKSKTMEKCSSKSGTSQTNVKKATSSASKESAGGKKIKKKSAESKSRKTKAKSPGEATEKCAESHATKAVEKLDCSEASVNTERKSTEKITTIYQKKQKAPEPPSPESNAECSNTTENIECSMIGDNIENNDDVACNDVQINYLFMPSTSSSGNSNIETVESDMANSKNKESLTKKENAIESKDFAKPPPHPTVNCALVKSIKFPVVKPGETKHVYLHSKLIFRTEGDNKGLTPRNFQECHLLIERDHYVLQEYSGKLYPDELSPGNYAQVNLLTRYPDPEDLKIHATECIAKLESQNELSIRAKFLILESNTVHPKISETFSTRKKSNDSIQKKKSFYDAQCQCERPKGTSIAINTKCSEEKLNTCKSLVKWDQENMRLQPLDVKNTEMVNVQSLNLRVGNEVDSRKRNEEKNLNKALVKQNCAIKLLKNLNTSGPESETNSKDSLDQKNEREVGKSVDDKSSIKNIKNSLGERKKTTFFVYDRVEKDENSGKKIFVGSFRTRDEIEVLYKHKNIFQSDRISSDLSDRQSNCYPTVIGGVKVQEDVPEKLPKAEDSQVITKEITSKEENPIKKSETKQIITLHKFRPKNYHLRTVRKKSKSIIVGKISSKVDTESEKYSQLANLLGLDKAQRPKISFYEFQESDTRNANNVILGNNSEFDATTVKEVENSEGIDKDKVFPSTSDRSESLDGEYGEGLEGTSSLEKRPKSLDKKDSPAAVVIIPIQVESLSKIEIILIEHAEDVKKAKVENKYTSYLKRYKRLILKLVFVSVVVRVSFNESKG